MKKAALSLVTVATLAVAATSPAEARWRQWTPTVLAPTALGPFGAGPYGYYAYYQPRYYGSRYYYARPYQPYSTIGPGPFW